MIRRATLDDALAIAFLYHDTVTRINSRDYAPSQIQAWAGGAPDERRWRQRLSSRTTLVEEQKGAIRGFAELEENGHIGAVYVHADHQRRGIASALLRELENEALARG